MNGWRLFHHLGEFVGVGIGDRLRVEILESRSEFSGARERGLHRHLLVEQHTHEQGQRVCREEGVGIRIAGDVKVVSHTVIFAAFGLKWYGRHLCCSRQIRSRQHRSPTTRPSGEAGRMSNDRPIPQFTDKLREQLAHQRILVLDGALDDDNGTVLATQLMLLAADDPHSDITLWIHSPGGSVASMLAIRDVMRVIPCDVATVAIGLACSAGQFLLSAGSPGKRYALPRARILMHQGSAGIGGSAGEVEVQANDLRHTRDTVLSLIAHDTGQPIERIFDDSLHDRWYTAEQAQAYGFIDHVVTAFEQVMPPRRRPVGLGVSA